MFPIQLFSSVSLHCSLKKVFLSLLALLWNSAVKWAYLSFSPLPFCVFSFLSYLSTNNSFGSLSQFQSVSVGRSPPHNQQASLRTPAGCPRIQLNSDTIYQEIRAWSHKTVPPPSLTHTADASCNPTFLLVLLTN